jgi:hypothetical protein
MKGFGQYLTAWPTQVDAVAAMSKLRHKEPPMGAAWRRTAGRVGPEKIALTLLSHRGGRHNNRSGLVLCGPGCVEAVVDVVPELPGQRVVRPSGSTDSVSLAAQAGAVIARAGVEANLRVTLLWKKTPTADQPEEAGT